MVAETVVWLPSVGSILLIVVGIVAAFGYARTQSAKTWREASEASKAEADIHRERATRLASDLVSTTAQLQAAERRTDITRVLSVLAEQHLEATELLRTIADEASSRTSIELLTRIADESAERNGHIASTLAESNDRQSVAWEKITAVAVETLDTVKRLERLDT